MGIMDKIKRATGTDEQYDDIYDNEYYDGFKYESDSAGICRSHGNRRNDRLCIHPRRILPRRRYVRGSFLLKHRRHKPFRKRDRDEGRKAGAF